MSLINDTGPTSDRDPLIGIRSADELVFRLRK